MRDDIRYLNDQVFPLSGRKALQWEEAVFSLQPQDVIPSDEEGPPSCHSEGQRPEETAVRIARDPDGQAGKYIRTRARGLKDMRILHCSFPVMTENEMAGKPVRTGGWQS